MLKSLNVPDDKPFQYIQFLSCLKKKQTNLLLLFSINSHHTYRLWDVGIILLSEQNFNFAVLILVTLLKTAGAEKNVFRAISV